MKTNFFRTQPDTMPNEFESKQDFVKSLLSLAGKTPVIDWQHPWIPKGKRLLLKLEANNPSGSIKDRSAIGLIFQAAVRGEIKPGSTIIESTSGNLGKALANIGAILNLNIVLVIDPKAPEEVKNYCLALGAKIELVTIADADGGFQRSRLTRVRELLKQYPNAVWLNQYDNLDNQRYHQYTSTHEISQLDVDAIVGTLSTGGHMSGISLGLKNNPSTQHILSIACDVDGSSIFGKPFKPYALNGLGLAWRAENTTLETFDYLSTVDSALAISMCRYFAHSSGTGFLLGGSGGVAIFSALALLHNKSNVNSTLVVLPDSGINYLNTLYSDIWLLERHIRLLDADELLKKIRLHEFSNNRVAQLKFTPAL